MIEAIKERTLRFMTSVPKAKRKQYGQFFTNLSTATFMASLFHIDHSKPDLHILDAGAGTGILSAALLQRLHEEGYQGEITLTCYETDQLVLPILKENLTSMQRLTHVKYRIIEENYLTSQTFSEDRSSPPLSGSYDLIIGNPPYLKLSKDSKEVLSMSKICYGAPNLYFLFWAMGIYNLREEAELVYIIPRSWTSGAYFSKFRAYMLTQTVITNIHLFESRNKVFDGECILQETMIIKVRKSILRPKSIIVSSTERAEFSEIHKLAIPYSTIVAENGFVYLATSEEDIKTLAQINSLSNTLLDLGTKMQTGLVVDFRTKEALRNELEKDAYPLIYAQHIREGKIIWPVNRLGEVITTDRTSLLQRNGNYLICKRFTAKEETRRLQCAILLESDYPEFKYISTHNKVNFIKCDTTALTLGLYVLFNSTIYDQYYRILNGSTQVNSTEINTTPLPDRHVIEQMGMELLGQDLTTKNCDQIINRWITRQ